MGISVGEAVMIAGDLRSRGVVRGRALTLGKQDTTFTFNALLRELSAKGLLELSGSVAMVTAEQKAVHEEFAANGRLLSQKPEDAAENYISDEFFFRFIGFDSIVSVDHPSASGAFEGASVAFDLNQIGLADIVGEHEFVYDGGTLEHVFNTPNVFRNIFETLAVGGWVFHNSPTNNTVDHGFYQFSPTLFYDYYMTNGYGDVEVYFCRGYAGRFAARSEIESLLLAGGPGLNTPLRYQPGMLNAVSYGGLDGAIYSTRCYARKDAATTWDRTPQQGTYVPLWQGG
jgi:hypothetical protein